MPLLKLWVLAEGWPGTSIQFSSQSRCTDSRQLRKVGWKSSSPELLRRLADLKVRICWCNERRSNFKDSDSEKAQLAERNPLGPFLELVSGDLLRRMHPPGRSSCPITTRLISMYEVADHQRESGQVIFYSESASCSYWAIA
jgi:hypothetical protein